MGVKLAILIAAAALALPGTVPAAPAVSDEAGCGAGSDGYAYAGLEATRVAHGVRATITPLDAPTVHAGHVAAWIGVGGLGAGAGGVDEWLQAGVASLPGDSLVVYAEIARGGGGPEFISLLEDVQPGESHRIGVLEMKSRPNWWRVWLDGAPATAPIHLIASSGRWKPIATAETTSGGQRVCNSFAFRFEQVGVATALGGSWQVFTAGYRFLDHGYRLNQLHPAQDGALVTTDSVRRFAFEARSPS